MSESWVLAQILGKTKENVGENVMSRQGNAKPVGIKDKFGYMMGDVANDFMFLFAGGYLMVFYTKILGVSAALVGTLFLITRIASGFCDIGMGVIVDNVKPAKDGRFRPWIRRMCVPVAFANFLMYQTGLANSTLTVKIIYMFITYLLWGGICYSAINIPYGSMAASISADAKDRASLSTWRSVGAQIANTVINAAVPVLIYHADTNGNQVVRKEMFTKLAGFFSICAIICYIICYKFTTERVQIETKEKPKEKQKTNIFKTLFSSRALFALIGSAVLLVFATTLGQSLNVYLYADYFKTPSALSTFNSLMLVITLGLSPFIVWLSIKFGKKETAVIGTAFTGIIYVLLCLMPVKSPWVYVAITFVGSIGYMYFQMAIWAFIADVLDDSEVRTYKRDDGVIYGVYSFARKLGQALAGGLGGFALTAIGYVETANVQTEQVKHSLYSVTTLGQGVAYVLVAVVLLFIYPLSKSKIDENSRILMERRENN